MKTSGQKKFAIVAATAILGAATLLIEGCALAQTEPPPERPFGEVEGVERGIVAAVGDTMIDLRTGLSGRVIQTRTPTMPIGIVGVSVPVTLGGEKKREVPGEEITVRLPDGRLVLVVQALSQPPYAVGEQVKILHEKPHFISGEARTRVARLDDDELLGPMKKKP